MKTDNNLCKDSNKDWKAAIVDNLYVNGKFEKNIFVHAKLIHRYNKAEDDYYKIMTPSANFQISYVLAKKIRFID